MSYLKGADLRFCFPYAKSRFSHGAAHLFLSHIWSNFMVDLSGIKSVLMTKKSVSEFSNSPSTVSFLMLILKGPRQCKKQSILLSALI